MTGGYRSVTGFWLGGLSSVNTPAVTGGYISKQGFWLGGLAAVDTPPPSNDGGYTSWVGFWLGGLSSNGSANTDNGWLGGKAVFGQWPGIQGKNSEPYSYVTNYQKYLADAEKLKSINEEIASKEQFLASKKQLLDNNYQITHNVIDVNYEANKADAQFDALVAQAQNEIKALETERIALMWLIREEEDTLVILLSQPFVH